MFVIFIFLVRTSPVFKLSNFANNIFPEESGVPVFGSSPFLSKVQSCITSASISTSPVLIDNSPTVSILSVNKAFVPKKVPPTNNVAAKA